MLQIVEHREENIQVTVHVLTLFFMLSTVYLIEAADIIRSSVGQYLYTERRALFIYILNDMVNVSIIGRTFFVVCQ